MERWENKGMELSACGVRWVRALKIEAVGGMRSGQLN
jgi:hypothetical protein